ncbi:MAG: metal-dependent transcriptional regulator [Candidatus Poseidoniaceae archaeon]|nr:metal-dependent transcriptional regulator [Candidatus Poseidoniaceae archaeon]
MSKGHFQEFEDEYMETLFEFWENDNDAIIRTGQVALSMNVSPASATEMIQRLASKELLDYQPYKGLRLTTKGIEKGGRIKKRHRLAECLLIDVLGFTGDAHEAACLLEHALTDELEESLDILLGRPTHDPTGRPIPRYAELKVELEPTKMLLLAHTMEVGQSGILFSVAMLEDDRNLLESMGFTPGNQIQRTINGIEVDGIAHMVDDALLKRLLIKPEH